MKHPGLRRFAINGVKFMYYKDISSVFLLARSQIRGKFINLSIGDKIVETLYLNRVFSENKRIRTPPPSPPFKVGVFVVFYR